MNLETTYRLTDGVQVRKEKFGLLFYDYRGPRLYFLPSQDLLPESCLDGSHTTEELIDSIEARYQWSHDLIRDRVTQILDLLQSKGLIYEQSIRGNGPFGSC